LDKKLREKNGGNAQTATNNPCLTTVEHIRAKKPVSVRDLPGSGKERDEALVESTVKENP